MSEKDKAALTERLMHELGSYGIPCESGQAEQLVTHLELVIKKNEIVNLTRILDPVDAVTLHIVDSLLPLASPSFTPNADQSFVDIGTGAGYPGIPLFVLTGMRGLLIDSVGKKVNAVNEFIEELGIASLRAEHARIEMLPLQRSERFDYACARAVAQSNVLIEYAAPLLVKHGRLVLEKARPSEDELRHARAAADLCGMTYVSCETFELPRGLGHREVLIFEKTGKPKIRLPRRNGLARKEPLGE